MGLGLGKQNALLAALALGAALLAGCGGGDGETTSTAASKPPVRQTTPQKPTEQGAWEKQANSGKPTGPAPTPSDPLPNEGTKEVAPGVPTVKGGDNSIQKYGTEGPSEERVEAATVLQDYLNARLAGSAAKACSYIADQARRELKQLVEQAQVKGKDKNDIETPTCAELVGKVIDATPKKDLRRESEIRVRSMRIEDGRAFLVYVDGDDTVSQIALVKENDEWKIAVFSGNRLIPTAGSSS